MSFRKSPTLPTNPQIAPNAIGPAYATRFHCFSCLAYNHILRYGPDGERTLCNSCFLFYTHTKLPLYPHPSGKLTAVPPPSKSTPNLKYAFQYLDSQGCILPWRHLCLNPRIVREEGKEGRTRSGNRFRLSWEGEEGRGDAVDSLIPRLSREIYNEFCDAAPERDVSMIRRKRPRACSSQSALEESKEGKEGSEKVARVSSENRCDRNWNGCTQGVSGGEREVLAKGNGLVRDSSNRDEARRRIGQNHELNRGNDDCGDAWQRDRQDKANAERQALGVANRGALATTAREHATRSDENERQTAQLVSVKAYFTRDGDVVNSSICRFKLRANSSFDVLIRELQLSFESDSLLYVFYIDDEGDEVSLTSDNEMLELFDIVKRNGISPVRMKVVPWA